MLLINTRLTMDPDKSVHPPSAPRRWRRRRYEALRIRKKIKSKQQIETLEDSNDHNKWANNDISLEETRDGPPKTEPLLVNNANDTTDSSSLKHQQEGSPASQLSRDSVSNQHDLVFNSFGMETPQSLAAGEGQCSLYLEKISLPVEKGQLKPLPLLPLDPAIKPSVSPPKGTINDLFEEKKVKDQPVKILLQPRASTSHAWQEYLKTYETSLDNPILYDDPDLDMLSSSTSTSSSSAKPSYESSTRSVNHKHNSNYESNACLDKRTIPNSAFDVEIKVISSSSKSSKSTSDPKSKGGTADVASCPSISKIKHYATDTSKPATSLEEEIIQTRNLEQISEENSKTGKATSTPSQYETASYRESLSPGVPKEETNMMAAALPLLYQIPWLNLTSSTQNESGMDRSQSKETISQNKVQPLNKTNSKTCTSNYKVSSQTSDADKRKNIIGNIPLETPVSKSRVGKRTERSFATEERRYDETHRREQSHDSDTLFDGLDSDNQRSLSYSEQSTGKTLSSSIDDSYKSNNDGGEKEKCVSFDTDTEQGTVIFAPSQNEVECVLSYETQESGELSRYTTHSTITSGLDNSTMCRQELKQISLSKASDTESSWKLNLDTVQIFPEETELDNDKIGIGQRTFPPSQKYEYELRKHKMLTKRQETEIAMLKRECDRLREDLLKKQQERHMWCSGLFVNETAGNLRQALCSCA